MMENKGDMIVGNENIEVALITSGEKLTDTNLEQIIYDLDSQIQMLSSQADKLDYLISVASGVLCGMLDIFWVGDFDLASGREIASEKVDEFVKRTAKSLGYEGDDVKSGVGFLEKRFPLPSDGNTPDFGGGLQHHLRDFGHHPTITGLIFSLLTQFTGMSYGTDVNGRFITVAVPEASKKHIGKNLPEKIFNGTIIWFFHLVSDMAGSKATAGLSGGTGIPGPLLALAKELSVLPIFKNIKVEDNSLSLFISKLFNGTLFAKRGADGKIIKDTVIKFDLRGELGALIELGRQAVPVIANECIVRAFYFIRRFASQIKEENIKSLDEIANIDWNKIKPYKNATLTRMLTISTAVFTTIDIGEAVITQKYWVAVNYVGLGRFVMALGAETVNFLKVRDVARIKEMYQQIQSNTYTQTDNKIYGRLARGMDIDKFSLNVEQTEILYNLEYYKTLNDISKTNVPVMKDMVVALKHEWLKEWQSYMERGFADFVQEEGAKLNWYSKEDLLKKIDENEPKGVWLRLVLLESMIFEPYYPLGIEKDKKGKDIPSKKYDSLKAPFVKYNRGEGDNYLDKFLPEEYYQEGYVKRLRRSYDKVSRELNEVLKATIKSLSITAGISLVVVLTAGALAPTIAPLLVGAKFAGLSGAALTSASLAYLGGGAIAAGGLGVAGGTAAIVGGGALLGIGLGAGIGGAVGLTSVIGQKATIQQSTKLIVSLREVFLNDERDIEYFDSVYEEYVQKIVEIEKELVDLKLEADVAEKDEKKKLKEEIKKVEESVDAMKLARRSMIRFKSSFEIGLATEELVEL